MARVALLFPGQGSQWIGMGRALCEEDEQVRSIFERVEWASGVELHRLCFDGPEDELRSTPNLQPCLLAMGVAAWTYLKQRVPIQPCCSAGHSVGEYAALVVAGALELEDAARIVRERGRLMQNAVPEGLGSMYALIGLDAKVIDQVLRDIRRRGGRVWPANFNGGGQVVISGLERDLQEALPELRAAGARRAVKLPVSAPFHCPLMQPAADGLRPFFQRVAFTDPQFPVYSNVEAAPHQSPERMAELLVAQIVSPVLWEDSVRQMIDHGADLAIELGAGSVLTKLLRRISDELPVLSFERPEDLPAVIEALA
ncbi:MAG: ACP S-malonyltransferase [Candidatus Alcyoniella australis]|nr:ACP S-malonyltransferase [Candidatus Alcyoniella australis]